MSIGENVRHVRAAIEQAAGGRSVCLVAATKMNDAAAVREAVAAGVDACGENRVQELLEKDAQGAYDGVPKHFIGHLQRNKVRQVVGRVDLIQSVDSEELLALIDRAAAKLGLVQDILIEVNVGGESQKSGVAPGDLPALLEKAAEYSGLRVRGLMCIPPVPVPGEENAGYFAQMYQLFIDNREKKYDNVSMEILSMGMTDDYLPAIAAGATMVRVGTGIFGPRSYGKAEAE